MPTFRETMAGGARIVGEDRSSDAIEVVDYDPAWPARFEAMRARLAEALGPVAVRIDHVGSTAVPGLSAKPVIDIQVSVPDVEDEAAYRDVIEGQGFLSRMMESHHHYFRPPPGLPREYQVHVCSVGSDWECVHLLFRDYLRADPGRAPATSLKHSFPGNIATTALATPTRRDHSSTAVVAIAEEWAKPDHRLAAMTGRN